MRKVHPAVRRFGNKTLSLGSTAASEQRVVICSFNTRQDKCSFNEVNWQIMGLLMLGT